ncbi:hypothetical protein MLD38_026588 [Melastoma candidum]|uniref:Uncharacterized protein n=1 Tax=Melastoma candidum TaxID=119954 RepID=A0ACB9P2K4_9MYRT|nr:hypothetical protein MLD38_026588 [Melastoma candidum]
MSDNDPHHWMHFYQLAPFPLSQPSSSSSESALVSTIPQSASPPPTTHPNPGPGGSSGLNPEGRVTKPARRRTRASRRTPTTVMNTDTTNFRAMVQQYTGGPPTASLGSGAGPSMLSFGFRQGQLAPSSSGIGHAQYSPQQPHQLYDNLLSLNTTNSNNVNSGNSQGNQWGVEGDRRIHFSLEGMGSIAREGNNYNNNGLPRRSPSSDHNGGNHDYIF